MFHFLGGQLVGMGIGFVAGAFMPGVLRKIKGLFVAETQAAEKKVGVYGADLKKKL